MTGSREARNGESPTWDELDAIVEGKSAMDLAERIWRLERAEDSEIGEIPEGCTPTDAKVLRQANHVLAIENHRLKDALRFYANGDHWIAEGDVPVKWDTCSGEPQNWYWRENDNDDAEGIEDGEVAKMALLGIDIDWEGEPPKYIEGEPEWLIEQEAKRLGERPLPL